MSRYFPKTSYESKSSTSVIIRGIEIKTTMKDHFIPVRMAKISIILNKYSPGSRSSLGPVFLLWKWDRHSPVLLPPRGWYRLEEREKDKCSGNHQARWTVGRQSCYCLVVAEPSLLTLGISCPSFPSWPPSKGVGCRDASCLSHTKELDITPPCSGEISRYNMQMGLKEDH